MKIQSNLGKTTVVLAAGLVSAWSLAAQDMTANAGNTGSWLDNVYVSGGAGVDLVQPITFSKSDGGDVVSWNAGPAFDASIGYNITENFSAELQSGVAVNSLSTIDGFSTGVPSIHLWTVPIMLNGIYNYSLNDHWQVYGGVGAGIQIGTLDITDNPNYSATDEDFAYQVMVGVKYCFNANLECGLGYDFLGSLDNHWSDQGFDLSTSPTYMHTILLTLTYKF